MIIRSERGITDLLKFSNEARDIGMVPSIRLKSKYNNTMIQIS